MIIRKLVKQNEWKGKLSLSQTYKITHLTKVVNY